MERNMHVGQRKRICWANNRETYKGENEIEEKYIHWMERERITYKLDNKQFPV